jgi:hypothetical protein
MKMNEADSAPSAELSPAAEVREGTGVPLSSAASVVHDGDAFDELLTALASGRGTSDEKAKEIARHIQNGEVSIERVRRAFRERGDIQGALFHAMLKCNAMHRVRHVPGPEPFQHFVEDSVEVGRTTEDDRVRATILMNITTRNHTYQQAAAILDVAEQSLFRKRERFVATAAIRSLRRLGELRDDFDGRIASALVNEAFRTDVVVPFDDVLRALHGVSRADFDIVISQGPADRLRLHRALIEELRNQPSPPTGTDR